MKPHLSLILAAAAQFSLATFPALSHPGSGIVVDRQGEIYFEDTGSGVWKLDTQGKLTQIGPTRFHWLALDADDRLRGATLPSGSNGEITRVAAKPTLLVASDFPIALSRDGSLYYPSHGTALPLQIMKLTPSGRTSVLARLPAPQAGKPLSELNGLATGPDESVYYTENKAIGRITPQGRVSTIVENIKLPKCASIPGNEAKDAPLLRGLVVADGGTIYVAASGCGSVLKVTPEGQITILLEVESPWSPTAVALFGEDLYVLEYLHTAEEDRRAWVPRVRKVSPEGKSTIIATVRR